jgi:hypothetical protein
MNIKTVASFNKSRNIPAGVLDYERSQRDVFWKSPLARVGIRGRTVYTTLSALCTVYQRRSR